MHDDPETLVSTAWLAERLDAPDLRVIDASWYLPDQNRDPRAEFAEAHVPGARYLDIDAVSDGGSDLPHMAPAPEKFVEALRTLGVGDGDRIVVYDGAGLFSAARIWWLGRLMGLSGIAVLDGGFPKWRAEGRPVESGTVPAPPAERPLTVTHQPRLVRDVTQVAEATKTGDHVILDARAPSRFAGEEPEPRPGLRAGHIPGSANLHYRTLLNPDGTMKEGQALDAALAEAGAEAGRPVITTCGSGVTAAILNLALERSGHRDHALYDGSWSEWGMFDDLKAASGR